MTSNAWRERLLRLRSGYVFAITLLFASLVGPVHHALAQASAGVTGTIVDPTGATIEGATVSIVNNATGVATNTVSSSSGTFNEIGLNPGQYTITINKPGFEKSVRDGVNIEVSTTATINFTLSVGQSNETVTTTADQIALDTSAPDLGTTIEPEVVAALPNEINGRGRQIDNFVFLAPGVQGNTFAKEVNGGVNFESEIVFNGIPVPQPETEGYQTNFNPPYEMVSEFRVERSTFSAQFGLAQGAVTYQMASGTNALHGDVFEINRNNLFDSRGYFNEKVPIDHENNYGFTVGGPVILPKLYNGKDKTFFHFSIEWYKHNTGNTNIGTVPLAAERAGDFSGFTDSHGKVIPIYDPTTGQQFQSNGVLNVIPANRISATSASLLQYLPDPDRPGQDGNKSPVANTTPQIQHVFGFTIDHNLTSRQSLHYSEWRDSYNTAGFDYNPIVPITNPLQSEKTLPYLGSGFLLTYANTVTPNLVATAGIGWIGELNNQFDAKQGSFAGVQDSVIFPNVRFDGQHALTNWGTSGGWIQSVNRKLGIAVVNNWLWTHGRQTFNFGGEFRRAYQDDNECQQCGGQIQFSQKTTSTPNSADPNFTNYGSAFASFLLGQVDSVQRVFANELRLRNVDLSPYVEDDIKFTPKLTVNLGLRWDIMVPFTENHDDIVYLNPNEANAAAGGLLGAATKFGSCTGCAGTNRADLHWGHVGPRLGVSYQLNDRTVVQGSFSLAFLDGGAYEYGTSKVAVSYGNLLLGAFQRNSTNTNQPGYGSWDANPIPAPPAQAFNPALGIGTIIRSFDVAKDGLAPYSESWNIVLQRQLPWNLFGTAAYVANTVIHLPSQLNPPNQPNPSILQYGSVLGDLVTSPAAVAAGIKSPYPNFVNNFGSSATVAQALAPYPQYAQIYNNFDDAGRTRYEGAQFSAEKRFTDGLAFLTSFTLSRTMGNVDSGFSTFAALPENKYNQAAEYTISGNDERWNTKVSGTYELPIGPGKKYFNTKGVVGQVAGGWQIGWITDYEQGTPFGISENGNPLGTAGGFNRPDRASGVASKTFGYGNAYIGQSPNPVANVFRTTAFVQTPNQYVLGDASRNYSSLRNPHYLNEDANVRKHFYFGEHVQGILQVDYFNLLNRTIFNGPDTNISDTTFGTITNVGQSNSNRQGQAQFRIEF